MQAVSQPVSPLRQRMLEDMAMRGLRQETQRNYLRSVRSFAGFLTFAISWQIMRPTTMPRLLRSTRMLHSIDLRRKLVESHLSLGLAVSIDSTFGWHNR
jgi:hypothetical protein